MATCRILNLRALIVALLLLVPMVGGARLSAAVSDNVTSAVNTVQSNMSSSGDKMDPVMSEATKTATWLIWLLWSAVPLVLFGALIAYGVWQAKQNETQAAWKTFAATGIGAIFYFGVLAIFFS